MQQQQQHYNTVPFSINVLSSGSLGHASACAGDVEDGGVCNGRRPCGEGVTDPRLVGVVHLHEEGDVICKAIAHHDACHAIQATEELSAGGPRATLLSSCLTTVEKVKDIDQCEATGCTSDPPPLSSLLSFLLSLLGLSCPWHCQGMRES